MNTNVSVYSHVLSHLFKIIILHFGCGVDDEKSVTTELPTEPVRVPGLEEGMGRGQGIGRGQEIGRDQGMSSGPGHGRPTGFPISLLDGEGELDDM